MMEQHITLPQAFVERMRADLGTEAEEFFASYESPRAYGLRRNPLKLTAERFEQLMPWQLTPVSWADEGYYYPQTQRPGKHVYHEMGLYYIQEPSAMCVAQIADPQPGERVLDLCAAPGGKSTQLAGRMAGEGLLVCNEIVPNRAKILAQNVERMGVKNAVVVNHSPQELEGRFTAFFDRIVVDAPCSGEGMFHKEEAALTEWSPENVRMCANRQREILACAVNMLAPGGVLVYSTCTFAHAEDEDMIRWLLETYPDLALQPIDTAALGISEGTLAGTGRIYPHRQRGEGHFVARLKKSGQRPMPQVSRTMAADIGQQNRNKKGKKNMNKGSNKNSNKNASADAWASYETFAKQYLSCEQDCGLNGRRQMFGEQLYLVPQGMPDLSGMKVLRPGLHLGTAKKNRFEPSHALALALCMDQVMQSCETDEPEQYLRGMTMNCDPALEGWVLVTYQGLPLGWGKASRGVVKNHYPKGLRINW